MAGFVDPSGKVVCVSSHYYEGPRSCDLCQTDHGIEMLVIKNRAGKKMHVAVSCLKEMVRFKVVDVDDLGRWLTKITELKASSEAKRLLELQQREEERKRLEKKVIVRRRDTAGQGS